MTEDANGVLITDGQNRIFLHPPEPYPDGHGFSQQVELVAGPFRGAIETSSYDGPIALQLFHERLIELCQTLRGEARLPDTYDTIKIVLRGDGLGHVLVRADVCTSLFIGQADVTTRSAGEARLSFSFSIDQTLLPKIIADVERFLP